MYNRFPRIRLVALSTASAAPLGVSASVRYEPTTRWPLPSPCTPSETITTVASNARTAFTPSSSKLNPPCTAWPRATTHAWAEQRSSPACEASPSPSPVNCSESLQVNPTRARQRPFGSRSRVNSAKRSRSGNGSGVDMASLCSREDQSERATGNGQSPCQSAEQLSEQCHEVIIGD